MSRFRFVAVALCPLFALTMAFANADESALPELSEQPPATVCRGVVTLVDEVRLPARRSAIVTELLADEGDTVKAGQVLGRLDDEEARADLAIAAGERAIQQLHMQDNIEERSAIASAEVASAEHAEALDINRRVPDTVAPLRVRRLRLAEGHARLEVEVAGMKHRIYELQHNLSETKVAAAEAELARRRLVSPLEGQIAQRLPSVGEWVEAGDPVFHIVRMDRLRLEWLAPMDAVPPHAMHGRPIVAEVSLGSDQTVTVEGLVSFVSPIVEPSGDYRVRCEFDNEQRGGRWLVRPGQVATVRVLPPADSSAKTLTAR